MSPLNTSEGGAKMLNFQRKFEQPSKKDAISRLLEDEGKSALFVDGFDDALIGVSCPNPKENEARLVYSYQQCLEIVMRDSEMSLEDADEWMQVNFVGAYVGEQTPIFMIELDKIGEDDA